jgi:hypothetical protein
MRAFHLAYTKEVTILVQTARELDGQNLAQAAREVNGQKLARRTSV